LRQVVAPARVGLLVGCLLLAACGTAAPPQGQPAAALVPVLANLASAKLPVYLPSRLPSPPAGSNGYAIDARATAGSYDVSIHWYAKPVPINAPVAVARDAFIAEIWGGAAGSLPPMPAATFTGQGESVAIVPGIVGTFYPGHGLGWTEGGWSYAIMSGFATTPASLLPPARRIQVSLPAAGNPIGPGTHGQLVMPIGAEAPDTWVRWTQGRFTYEIDGLIMPGDEVARALVRVTLP
jgi:hypothetical protein